MYKTEEQLPVTRNFAEFMDSVLCLVLIICCMYAANNLLIYRSIKKGGVVPDRNFANWPAIHKAEQEGLKFKVLSEAPLSEHYYATDINGRPLE
jgi:hypothetical protein